MARTDTSGGRGSRAGASVLWWAVSAGLYVSFVSFVWTQLVAGALVAGLAVGLSRLALRSAGLTVGGAAPHVWRLRAVGAILAGELRAVTTVLAAHLTGRRAASGRFAAVDLPHAVDAAQDVAITLEASVAPNTYVVGLLQSGHDVRLLVHQLTAQDRVLTSFPRWRP